LEKLQPDLRSSTAILVKNKTLVAMVFIVKANELQIGRIIQIAVYLFLKI
jgi:hypothetical protein